MEGKDPYEFVKEAIETATDQSQNYQATTILTQVIPLNPFYLQFLDQYMPNSKSVGALFNTCKTIYDLMTKRGCLISEDILSKHLDMLYNAIKDLAINRPALFNNSSIGEVARCFAGSYRALFEKTGLVQPFGELLDSPSRIHKLIGLKTLNEIVYNIKNQQNQISDAKFPDFRAGFFKRHLRMYIEAAVHFLDDPKDTECTYEGVKLLHNCLCFTCKQDDMLQFKFNVPADWVGFYTDFMFPEKLFNIYIHGTTEMADEALDALLMFCSAVDWKAIDQHMNFIQCIAQNITGILSQNINKCHNHLARLICKVGLVLPLQHFITSDLSQPFFEQVYNYTKSMFLCPRSSTDSNEPDVIKGYLLNFWGRASAVCSVSPSNYPPVLLNIFTTIFQEFVDIFLNQIIEDQDPINYIDYNEHASNFEQLWNVASVNITGCTQFLISKIDECIGFIGQGIEVSKCLLRLSAVILIISSRFSTRPAPYTRNVSMDYIMHKAQLTSSIFNIIGTTDGILVDLYNEFPVFAARMELSLVAFADAFKRDMFTQRPEVNGFYEAMQLPNGRKIAFDNFVNRFIRDLVVFVGQVNLLKAILRFIDDVTNASKIKDIAELANANEKLFSLITRQNFVAFEGIEKFSDLKKLVVLLNTIYGRNIKSTEALKRFVDHFDERFKGLRAQNYNNAPDVFVLFCEIRGVLKGIQVPHFLTVATWYMNNYVDDALTCLSKFSENADIVLAILNSWLCIASNKGRKIVIPSGSADGIRIFLRTFDFISVISNLSEQFVNIDSILYYKIFRFIFSSVSNTYANFGVMKHFKDERPLAMFKIFFDSMANTVITDIIQYSKEFKAIISSISYIVDIFPEYLLAPDMSQAIDVAVGFLKNSLAVSIGVNDKIDEWKEVCKAIYKLLTLGFTNSGEIDVGSLMESFRPHFLFILDAVISPKLKSIIDDAAPMLFLMIRYYSGFCYEVFGRICESFEDNAEQVAPIFENLKTAAQNCPDGIIVPPKPFKYALDMFKTEMIRFPTSIVAMEEYAELLELQN